MFFETREKNKTIKTHVRRLHGGCLENVFLNFTAKTDFLGLRFVRRVVLFDKGVQVFFGRFRDRRFPVVPFNELLQVNVLSRMLFVTSQTSVSQKVEGFLGCKNLD